MKCNTLYPPLPPPQVRNTPLHLACQNGHAQSAKVLLLGGSRPDAKNQVRTRSVTAATDAVVHHRGDEG